MGTTAKGPRHLGFGLFEADLCSRELRKRGIPVHIQGQPFAVLSMLLEHPGEPVTREELQKRLWPTDTYVDFDEGLNTAIKKLRYALADSPDNPTFIETIPRRGYRFIAPVKILGKESIDPKTESNTLAGDSNLAPDSEEILKIRPQRELSARLVHQRKSWDWVLKIGAIGCMLIVGFAVVQFRRSGSQRVMHFSIALPSAVRDVALSPDGRLLIFVAPVPMRGGTALWIVEVGAPRAHPLEKTEGASYPFWSPDSRAIGFFADGKLKTIDAVGGPVQVICDAPIGRGGTWNRNDVIVFAGDSGVGLNRVSAAGGPVALVTGFEQKVATTRSNRWPVFLPDGRHFLYTSVDFGANLQGDTSAIYVGSLDSGQHRRLVASNSNASYVPPGYLLFFGNRTLMAQRFDARRLEMVGEAFAIANEVEYLGSVARALFSVSQTGTLVYQTGSGATSSQLAWCDRHGKRLAILGAPDRYANPRLSPDGKSVAVDVDDPQSFNTDIWLLRQDRGPLRFTFDPAQDEAPLWSHDGSHILWLSDRGGRNGFYLKASVGSGVEKDLTVSAPVNLSFASAPSDWSSDGRFLLYTDMQEGKVLHLWVLPLTENRPSYRLFPGDSAEVEGQFSPDGRWVAYSSNESGKWQVYVAPFESNGSKYEISLEGGQQPRWRRDGKELFFLSLDRKLMVVSVKVGSTFQSSPPTTLFETRAHEPITAEEFFTYDVNADGRRFLINENAEERNPPPVDIILNWASQTWK